MSDLFIAVSLGAADKLVVADAEADAMLQRTLADFRAKLDALQSCEHDVAEVLATKPRTLDGAIRKCLRCGEVLS